MLSWLLVIVCIVAGFMVSFNYITQKVPSIENFRGLIESTRFYVGLTSVILGIINLIYPYSIGVTKMQIFAELPFLGDLLPSIAAIASGIFLWKGILAYVNFSKDPQLSDERKIAVENFLDMKDDYLGLITIALGIIHIIDLAAGGIPLI